MIHYVSTATTALLPDLTTTRFYQINYYNQTIESNKHNRTNYSSRHLVNDNPEEVISTACEKPSADVDVDGEERKNRIICTKIFTAIMLVHFFYSASRLEVFLRRFQVL